MLCDLRVSVVENLCHYRIGFAPIRGERKPALRHAENLTVRGIFRELASPESLHIDHVVRGVGAEHLIRIVGALGGRILVTSRLRGRLRSGPGLRSCPPAIIVVTAVSITAVPVAIITIPVIAIAFVLITAIGPIPVRIRALIVLVVAARTVARVRPHG